VVATERNKTDDERKEREEEEAKDVIRKQRPPRGQPPCTLGRMASEDTSTTTSTTRGQNKCQDIKVQVRRLLPEIAALSAFSPARTSSRIEKRVRHRKWTL
jgi:hypothetical protein